MAQKMDRPAKLRDFEDILPNWIKDNVLESEVLEQNLFKMDFNVTLCRYAEM